MLVVPLDNTRSSQLLYTRWKSLGAIQWLKFLPSCSDRNRVWSLHNDITVGCGYMCNKGHLWPNRSTPNKCYQRCKGLGSFSQKRSGKQCPSAFQLFCYYYSGVDANFQGYDCRSHRFLPYLTSSSSTSFKLQTLSITLHTLWNVSLTPVLCFY